MRNSKAVSVLAALAAAAAMFWLAAALAQEGAVDDSTSVDAALAGFIVPISDWLSSLVFYRVSIGGVDVELIVLWLAAALLSLTFYFGFVNLRPRSFRLAWRIMRGRYEDATAPGQVTQFQALSTALSGTVGIGNIAGVAIAMAWGGPGATFWMILIGLCAMSVKFAECTLGVKYREQHADGSVSGGPMYYLKHGLANRGYVKLGLFLSGLYAAFGIPTILQWATVNQMYSISSEVGGFTGGWIFGLVLAGLAAAVIIGGITSIARVTVRLVPLMAAIYLLAALTIIVGNFDQIPTAIGVIFSGAFSPEAVEGGIIGVIIVGMRRAIYSTEAGLGTSSMAHSAAKTREPVSEGLIGLMEPFIDTVIICTMTALVIVITGAYEMRELSDVKITLAAFTSVFPWFDGVLTVAVLLFGFSTVISWAYYTEKIWTFVLGESRATLVAFRVIFCLLLVPGGVFTAQQVFDIIDSLFFLLALPNIIGLYIMAPEIKADMIDYFRRVDSGAIVETKGQATAGAGAAE